MSRERDESITNLLCLCNESHSRTVLLTNRTHDNVELNKSKRDFIDLKRLHTRKMFANRELTNEEYSLLPCYAKAFQCSSDEKFDSNLISCSPAYLKFPHDDPSQHVVEIVIRNRTNDYLELDVESPKTNIFQVFYDQKGIFGGCQAVLYVQCTPYERQVCFDNLKIRVSKKGNEPDVISVPLQLFPGFLWFSLPKLIVMPHVTVGNSAEVMVSLPKVPSAETFFISIRSPESEAFIISPKSGIIGSGCSDGVKEFTITYSPKEFITLVYIIEIHFPGVDNVPHDIIIFARSIPGSERDQIFRETREILSWKPKPLNVKIPEPKLHFRSKSVVSDVYNVLEDGTSGKLEDLTKPAGVIHFLLKKGGKFYDARKAVGALGLTFPQERKIYDEKFKEFHNAWNRENIRQKNIQSQIKPLHGSNPIEDQPHLLQQIIHERDMHRMQYEKALGLAQNQAEDMTRKSVVVSDQRSLRRRDEDFSDKRPGFDISLVSKMEDEYHQHMREIALRLFVQAAYIIVTRNRANKRIVKLRKMILRLRQPAQPEKSTRSELPSTRKIINL